MRGIRTAIIISMEDSPEFCWTVDGFLETWRGSGEHTDPRMLEEALHQFVWTDVLRRQDDQYFPGELFHTYATQNRAESEPQ